MDLNSNFEIWEDIGFAIYNSQTIAKMTIGEDRIRQLTWDNRL